MRRLVGRLIEGLVVLGLCGLNAVPRAFALAPAVDIHELQHTGWTIGDGAPPDIWGLAQGPDGFLWLATGAGLYRFDGVTFEQIDPAKVGSFPSLNMTAIAASPKGEVWIGYYSAGVSELVGGKLKNFSELDGIRLRRVFSIVIGHDNDVWVASDSGLYRLHHEHWEHIDRRWNYPYSRADSLQVARDGTIWAAGPTLTYLKPGATQFTNAGIPLNPYSLLAEDHDGHIWIEDRARGILPLDEALKASALRRGAGVSDFIRARSIMFDADGVLWGTDADRGGLFRVHSPKNTRYPVSQSELSERFDERDGLTSDIAAPMLEDREGDIWVGTNLGLDRFRANSFVRAKGVSSNALYGFYIANDPRGDVLAADANSLWRFSAHTPGKFVASLPFAVNSLVVDAKGKIWIAARDRAYYTSVVGFIDDDHFYRISLPPGAENRSISIIGKDPDGGLFVGIGRTQIDLEKNGICLPFGPTSRLPDLSYTVAFTDSRDRLWVGFAEQAVAVVDRGSTRVFTSKDGLAIGHVTAIAEIGGHILIGGEQGLAEFDGRFVRSIAAQRVRGFSGITGIAQSRDKAIWTNGILGIVRVPGDELQKAFRDSGYDIHYRLFDHRDGVIGMAQQAVTQATAVAGRDGRLWFVTSHGVISVDPLHLTFNTHRPPVAILSLTVDGQSQSPENQTLPAGAREVRIDYTATSLQVPERVRFRYMLEGFSDRWTDPGKLRQAFFTNLPPGRYRFRVIAANNDGVWNGSGAALSFVVPPTFLQSWTFVALCILTGAILLWALYTVRLEQMAGRARSRLEERIRERERIARELHDTLLQSVQGLVLRFYAAIERMPKDDPHQPALKRTIERANEVLFDARERVRLLRTAGSPGDLAAALREAGEELAQGRTPAFRVIVEGATRELHAIVFEELIWVGREALINAFTHAEARHVVAEVSYHWRELRLQIRDDGRGLPEDVVVAGAKADHFGLPGIRERVNHIRGRLSLQSGAGSGTALTVVIPATIAYKDKRRRWSFGRLRRLFAEEIES